jgi:hypothetical protein
MVPRVIQELLGAKLVTPPPSSEDIPSPLTVDGEVVEGCLAAEPANLGIGLAVPPPTQLVGPSSREGSQRVHPP